MPSERDLEAEIRTLRAQVHELERQLLQRGSGPGKAIELAGDAPLIIQLEAMLGFAPATLYVVDHAGKLVHITASASKSHLLGQHAFDLAHPDSRDEYRHRLDQVLALGEPVEFEYKARADDTQARWYRALLCPWRQDGHVVGAVAVCAPIDDERQTRIENKRFRAILDQAFAAIFVVDPRTAKYVDVNTTACGLLGYTRSELLLLGFRDIEDDLPLDTRGRWADFMIQIMAEGTLVREGAYRRKDGSTFPVEESLSIKPFEGDEYLLVVSSDITEAKRIKEELRHAEQTLRVSDRLTTVGTLAAGVAHEINNPLAYVMGNIEFAIAQIEEIAVHIPDAVRLEVLESLNEARHGATRMSRIVRDLRTFSRRSDDDSAGPVSVNDVLDSSINIAMNEIRPRAQLRRECADGLMVIANESRLGQVFLNLIINAAQAIPLGDSKNQLITVRSFTDGHDVVVDVSDTGPGMTPDVASRIFEAFFTTKPVGVGTGLGLSICQNIVEGLGGEISVDTDPGKGTTFRVRLPSATTTQAHRQSTLPPQRIAKSGRILIIDDDLRAAKALRRILHTHDVLIEHEGRAGLEHVTRSNFDIIFCDMMMPDFGGIEFYETLKQELPDEADKVVFVTGGTFTQRAREFLESTENDYVSKPYDAQEVRRMVSDRLRGEPR